MYLLKNFIVSFLNIFLNKTVDKKKYIYIYKSDTFEIISRKSTQNDRAKTR